MISTTAGLCPAALPSVALVINEGASAVGLEASSEALFVREIDAMSKIPWSNKF